MQGKRVWMAAFLVAIVGVAFLANVAAAKAPERATGRIYANGVLWATFGTPAAFGPGPQQSMDKLFKFPGTDLVPVAEASPGDPDYNGGRWDVHLVTFTGMEPTQFTSDEEVLYHASLGHLTIGGTVDNFECPLFEL